MKMTNRERELADRKRELADIPKACGCDREIPDRQIDEHDTECIGCGIVSA